MDYKRIILCLWIIIINILVFNQACVFHSRNGYDSESDGVRFIRVREDLSLGGEVLYLNAFPRNSIVIKSMERSSDSNYFRIKEVNTTTVQILLDKSLEDLVDRDVPQNLLKFKIQCNSVVGRIEETSFLTVTVYVEDINDHSPKFMNSPYVINVDESTPVGSTIYNSIGAFDRDKPNTPNSDVQFSLGTQDYPGGPFFSLESPHRPALILRRNLDYDEGVRKFQFMLIASDRGTPPRSSNTTIRIIVMDSDDLPPKFSEGVYRTRINEFSPITSKPIRVPLKFVPPIMARDQDSLNATLMYDIISGNERRLFWVNPNSGTLFLDREVDLEEESLPGNTFVLQLEARQKQSPLKRALARVEIEVLDLNDNAPEFEVDLYNISIVENLPSGFSVLQVNAVDRDQGENSEFFYHLIAEKPSGAFLIDPRTGWLTVRDQSLLDREARSSITMTVRAVEKVEPYDDRDDEVGTVQVEVTLLDSNDNTPQFEMGNLYEFKISLNAQIGHVVGHVKAIDPDEGRNGMILYELQRPRASGVIPFKLDSQSGALIVSGPLNVGRIALFVEASDQPTNPSERRFSLAVVTIEISRQKVDNIMDFIGAPYEFWVGADVEVGTSVGQIRTTADWEMERGVMYDLLHSYPDGVPFAVEERTGTVTVIRKLEDFNRHIYEFEAVASHESFANRQKVEKSFAQLIRRSSKSQKQLTHSGEVIEIDEGVVSDSKNMLVTKVTVHVVNSDDERGVLMRGTGGDPIEFHVKENAAGVSIGQLLYTNKTNIVKKDIGRDSSILSDSSTTRGEKRKSKQMSSTKFNKNLTKFNEVAKNSRRRHRDANAETSFFVPVAPTIFFEESLMDDSTTFKQRKIRSSIEYPSSPYDENFEPKKMLSNSSLNRKIRSRPARMHRYDTEISRNDSFLPTIRPLKPWSTIEPFLPTLKASRHKSYVTISGSSNVNTYRPSPSPFSSPVSNRTPIPFVTASTNSVSIIHPSPKPTNVNETVPQNLARKKVEFEPHRGLRFLIANQQDVTDMITITNDGVLMTLKGLDREARDVYRLTIIAEYSKGVVSGAGIYQVTVYVDDENDNAPTFNQNSFTGMISENSPVGTDVLLNQIIIVKDNDIGENADFKLTLFGDGSNLFTLELVNGTNNNSATVTPIGKDNNISIEKSFASLQIMLMDAMSSMKNVPHYAVRYIGSNILDRERESFYNLKIVARDKGGLKSEVKLGIYIADVNDNAPVFEQIAIFKNAGVEILEHANEMELYYLDQIDDDDQIIHKTGKIKPIAPAKFETSTPTGFALYKDRLKEAMDRINIGTPRYVQTNGTQTREDRRRSLRAKKNVSPQQINKEYSAPLFSILENVQVGANILKITATDDDYEGNSQVFYEIVAETFIPKKVSPRQVHTMKYFNIDRISGEFKINRPLPAESEIRLNVSAKDIGGLADYTMIRFKVIDVNDHSPVFSKSWYTFDLDEGSYEDEILGRIEALDEDFGQNSIVTYSIHSKEKLPFKISPSEGILTVTGDLDREETSRYEFKIMATDNAAGNDRMYSFVEVEVSILDLNDNAPEFTGYDELHYRGGVYQVESARKLTGFYDSADLNANWEYSDEKLFVYKAYLNRNVESGTLVKHVTAVDKDFAGNGNGLVMYSILNNKLPYMFEIDSREGIISTVSKLNKYRGYEHINLTVIASDLGNPSMSSTALVLVNLQGEGDSDKDEVSDIFDHKYYELEVQENNQAPIIILQINTTTPDESYKWKIVPEVDSIRNDEFKIDTKNGTLWLVKSLDREINDVYRLKISAEKILREGRNTPMVMYPVMGDRVQGLSDNEVRVIIRVTDENDNAPFFKGNGRPIVAVIPSTANFGYPVTTVKADDLDIGINADIRYSLLNEPSKLFKIDPLSGRIRVLGPIKDNQKVYGFDVKATDREGDDDGKSAISNVFVYVLNENRQVRLVLAGRPVDIEKEIENLTKVLSEATDLDVRVHVLEPHSGETEPATDVYIYAVDPKTNAVVNMEELQTMMSTIDMTIIEPPIVELPQLGGPKSYSKIHTTRYGALNGTELASIILAIIIFAGGLATAFCIWCVRYKRRSRIIQNTNNRLGYTITKAPSTMRTQMSRSTNNTRMSVSRRPRLYQDNISSRDREREYIDVPLPQSVLNSNFNLMDHDPSCLRFNQLRSPIQTMNLDTSVTSLHSSGRDSGLDMSRERSESPSRHHRWSKERDLLPPARPAKCICGVKKTGNGDESDSYEDSLKDVQINRRTSLPRPPGLRRSVRNPLGSRSVRHSFSGVRDDLTQGSPGLLNRTRFNGNSIADLEERLRNMGITFHEPFVLNNSRC